MEGKLETKQEKKLYKEERIGGETQGNIQGIIKGPSGKVRTGTLIARTFFFFNICLHYLVIICDGV